jgi:hypothetical protein
VGRAPSPIRAEQSFRPSCGETAKPDVRAISHALTRSYLTNSISLSRQLNLTPTLPVTDTRGIHGLTCNMSGSSSPAAIYLDGPNQSLKDVVIQGSGSSQDGILIGSRADAESDIVFNISGSSLRSVVHISGQQSISGVTPPSNCPHINSTIQPNNVCDLTLLGISGSAVSDTIKDDLTNPGSSTIITDSSVGMYIVGEQVSAAGSFLGYSRFTTSRNVPTWLVGSGNPSSLSCAPEGSLYSETSGSYTLLACKNGTWQHIN